MRVTAELSARVLALAFLLWLCIAFALSLWIAVAIRRQQQGDRAVQDELRRRERREPRVG